MDRGCWWTGAWPQVLFTLTPEKGIAVTALAFRTDDQDDVLYGDVSGRVTGGIWRSDRFVAHLAMYRRSVSYQLHFLDGQSVMLSSGHDNTLKEWIFDRDDGEARLLRFRAGHSKPPTNVSFTPRKETAGRVTIERFDFSTRFETSKT